MKDDLKLDLVYKLAKVETKMLQDDGLKTLEDTFFLTSCMFFSKKSVHFLAYALLCASKMFNYDAISGFEYMDKLKVIVGFSKFSMGDVVKEAEKIFGSGK